MSRRSLLLVDNEHPKLPRHVMFEAGPAATRPTRKHVNALAVDERPQVVPEVIPPRPTVNDTLGCGVFYAESPRPELDLDYVKCREVVCRSARHWAADVDAGLAHRCV